MLIRSNSSAVFACHAAACRPPRAGGTGGSSDGKTFRGHTIVYPAKSRPSRGSLDETPLPDLPIGKVKLGYRPRHPDGRPDPGEIVWAHVPFADDPSKGKNRPVLIVGRAENGNLVGVQLTSKLHRKGIGIEWGPDRQRSVIRTDRLIQVDPANNFRKEGAYVRKPEFQSIVDQIAKAHGLPGTVQLAARGVIR